MNLVGGEVAWRGRPVGGETTDGRGLFGTAVQGVDTGS